MEFELITDRVKIIQLMNPIEIRRKIGELNKMNIWVYTREGDNIPHFHIKKEGLPDACLKILECDWFSHGKNSEILYKKDLKKLCNWLSKDNYLHWKDIIIDWNKHTNNKININIKMPNYLNII